MAGFYSDGTDEVLVADNVNFSGSGSTPTVTIDGQLLIGATVSPNIRVGTLTAGTGITITNGEGSIEIASSGALNDYHDSLYIVGASAANGANYASITSAIAAASAAGGGTVMIQPGTYTENLTGAASVNLVAHNADAYTPSVIILGTYSASFAGTASFSGIQFKTNGAAAINVTGSSATNLNFMSCTFNGTDATPITINSSGGGSIYFKTCDITSAAIPFTCAGSAGMEILGCRVTGASGSPATFSSSGGLRILNTYCNAAVTTSGTGFIYTQYTTHIVANQTCLTIGGSATNQIFSCFVDSGTASAISISATATVSDTIISSTNTNAITGAGTLNSSALAFTNTSANINTTTQTVQPYLALIPRTAVASSPYTVLSTDYLLSVSTAAARTINLPNAPATNQVFIIKDRTGGAVANNITITTPGGAVTIDGAVSYTIANAYGSITVVFNGTSYEVI